MFWKLLISLLILPSFLGFDIVEASIKHEINLPKSEEVPELSQQTLASHNIVNSSTFSLKEDSLIDTNQKADIGEVKQINYEYPYKIAHEYYSRRSRCNHSYRRYHRQSNYYPDYIDYRRSYNREYYYPGYYHRRYYNSGYYRPTYYHNNGYNHHQYYRPRYHNNGYYYNGY
ncbi:hypothetical protein G7B40_004380 [Aetokthonos hydrillicola Thurmond2011]|uniref:Uncharacterized protein n=1 Tax=Aetokthonos hydrillicola Thurmond2011 TaxID=2712845 RepID=A0AAP5M3I0_9CYAN|nr:hypothetical protein [Aetokthonos hydrillicola]MBO3457516.1 hypothetical protein [Aetokthonos hydrillicola CCALA 1050]MBW4585962.1 hypothetical protein [Aetokthonos hydrillicola CCALA 1050]MDR9893811.1 hypothetical protein [Aetokthonos hydrillicola Thurmond2011]